MATYYPIRNLRLRVDGDGSVALEVVVPTGHTVDVIAEWQIEYLPSEAQDRIRAAFADENGNEPPLDVPTNRPDTRAGTHPQG